MTKKGYKDKMTKVNFRTNPEQLKKAHSAREMNRYPRVKTNPRLAGEINRIGQVLPQETADLLKSLDLVGRNSLIHALTNKGWTQASIGNALDLSRETIRQVIRGTTAQPLATEIVLPEPPRYPMPTRVEYTMPNPELLARLKELQPFAQQVRSSSKKFRSEAEEYSYLLDQATKQGVTVYRLAKLLGVTPSAIQFRLVRYGYRNSNGESKSYQTIKKENR